MAKEKDMTKKATVKKTKGSPSSPTTLGNLPDKLLELILLHLASPLFLVRAAATCKRWRRVIVDTNFLAHIDRSPCPVAGYYHYHRPLSSLPNNYSLAFVPSSSAAALGVDSRRHFSLDFLPGGSSSWELIDSHGSLVLLAKSSSTRCGHRRGFFPDLVVCEPVTRRYKLIHRMEEMKHQHCLGVFLDEYETCIIDMWRRIKDSMSMYRVISVVYMEYNGVSDGLGTLRVCVYNPNCSASWSSWKRRSHPTSWYTVRCGIHLRGYDSVRFLGHTAGSVFWGIRGDDALLVLDKWRTEFEVLRLPDSVRGSELRAVIDGSRDNKLRVVCLDEGNVLRVFATWRSRYGNGEWVLQKTLQLKVATVGIAGYKEGYFGSGTLKVVTTNVGSVILTPVEKTTWMFSVDLETMEVAKCKKVIMAAYPCELPWLPTLRACVTRCERRRYGRCFHVCICDA